MEELTRAVESAEEEKVKRYVLWASVNDLDDIRDLSVNTINYSKTLYKSMEALDAEQIWDLVPRIVSDVFTELFKKVDAAKEKGKTINVKVGDFITVGIEYADTKDADKDGTFNPIIEVGSELQYDNEDPDKNVLPNTVPVFSATEQDTIDFVSKLIQTKLKSKYGVIIEDSRAIEFIFTSFMRQLKQYLIDNKDKADYGCDISLGETINIGITKFNDGKDKYCVGIEPGRLIKMEYAKSDDKSEEK